MSDESADLRRREQHEYLKERLVSIIELACDRIILGKEAENRWFVTWQRIFAIASIALSCLGGAGLIVNKVAGDLFGKTGWEFWGSMIVLIFGIISQVASELNIVKRAADSRKLSLRCYSFQLELERMVREQDPRADVGDLAVRLENLIVDKDFIEVLPKKMTEKMKAESASLAGTLVGSANWNFKIRSRGKLGSGTSSTAPDGADGVDRDEH